MQQSASTGHIPSIKKRIAVSRKRQITLPIEFFSSLEIGDEVECFIQNNAIVIRPVRDESGVFDEQILADLISQGFSGLELLNKFKETRKQIRPAVERLIAEANNAAKGKKTFGTYEDIFGPEEK